MSQTQQWPPNLQDMHSLLPAFGFTDIVTSNHLGAVFFANQKSLDRQVTLKVFSPSLAADDTFRRSFETSPPASATTISSESSTRGWWAACPT